MSIPLIGNYWEKNGVFSVAWLCLLIVMTSKSNLNWIHGKKRFRPGLGLGYHLNDDLSFKFGGEFGNNRFEENYRDIDQNLFSTDLRDHYSALFAETNLYISKKLVARLGLRGEYSSLLEEMNLAPRLSMAYKTGDDSQVSFAYGHFYQNPVNEVLRFNQDLQFEKATHWILNFQKNKR